LKSKRIMKFQLVVLLFGLLALSNALPVPDEEVSVVKPAAVTVEEVKSSDVKEVEKKPVEVVQAESRSAAETPIALPEEKLEQKPIELEKKIDLPISTPDAELTLIVPEQKKEELKEIKVEKAAEQPQLEKKLPEEEKKEEKKQPESIEKQTRAEEQVFEVPEQEVKALPVVEAPAANIGDEKQVVQEGKSVVQDVAPAAAAAAEPLPVVPEGKSAGLEPAAEEKKEELPAPAAETLQTVKSDLPAGLVAEEKPLEEPALSADVVRQERVSIAEENKVEENKVDHVQVVKAVEPIVEKSESAVVPEVKSLKQPAEETKEQPEPQIDAKKIEEPAPAPAAAPAAIETAPLKESELKTTKLEEKLEAAGEIQSDEQQSSEELNKAKDLKVAADDEQPKEEVAGSVESKVEGIVAPEAKKIDEADSEPPAPIALPSEQKLKEEPKPIEKKEDKPAPTLKSGAADSSSEEEKKNSDESKDSKESEESKEKSD